MTGGSRGMGEAMALGFAHYGANVVLAARDVNALTDAAKKIEAEAPSA